MEYIELVQERLDNYAVEQKRIALESEVRRLGLTAGSRSPFAHLDQLIIRASQGASQRQARRGHGSSNQRELA